MDIDLLAPTTSDDIAELPNESRLVVKRHLRTVPCDADRQPVDVASDPFVVHCVTEPAIGITRAQCRWTWGETPTREIEFSLATGGDYPRVDTVERPTAPSTLLLYTPPSPSMLDETSCVNVRMIGPDGPVERQNRIKVLQNDGGHDVFVIPLDVWPECDEVDFNLVQEWHGGWSSNTLWDFLQPLIHAIVVPGIRPEWAYCGGRQNGFDSLYGLGDPVASTTRSPLVHSDLALCGSPISGAWLLDGRAEFNDFMSSRFRGTRTVTLDGGDPDDMEEPDIDERPGSRAVTVTFETIGEGDNRFILPRSTEPVMMREQWEGGESLWRVSKLTGKIAGLYATDHPYTLHYGGRRGIAWGRSLFEPPRMQIWLSVRVGYDSRYREIWADIHYDLRSE